MKISMDNDARVDESYACSVRIVCIENYRLYVVD